MESLESASSQWNADADTTAVTERTKAHLVSNSRQSGDDLNGRVQSISPNACPDYAASTSTWAFAVNWHTYSAYDYCHRHWTLQSSFLAKCLCHHAGHSFEFIGLITRQLIERHFLALFRLHCSLVCRCMLSALCHLNFTDNLESTLWLHKESTIFLSEKPN